MPRIYYPACRAILHVAFGTGAEDDDDQEYAIPVLPKTATIHCNSYRQADSFELTFEASDLPIDPQLVRAGSAEIYLFQLLPGMRRDHAVESRQFATEEEAMALRGSGSLDKLEGAQWSAAARDSFTLGNRPRIVGLFDEQGLEMSDDGRWVTISGQDYTALLAAKQWPPVNNVARKIPVGRRLDLILRSILDEADPSGRLALRVEGVDPLKELPVVGKAEASTNGRGIPVEETTSYWDVMYKLSIRYGFILFVRGLDVVLTRPRNITDLATVDIKRLAWGHNLAHVTLKRHLGKEKVPRIIVKGYDPAARKAITVEYPPIRSKDPRKVIVLKGKTPKKASTDLKVGPGKVSKASSKVTPTIRKEDEFQIIPVFGVTDREALLRAAETFFHLLGRSERQLIAVTRDLADMGDATRPSASLLDLNAGDAVKVEWVLDRELLLNKTAEERYHHLIAHGFNPEVAQVIAREYTRLVGDLRPMRLHEVSYEYSVDDGISIELQLNDFIEVQGARDHTMSAKEKRRRRVRDAAGRQLTNPRIEGGR